MENKNQSIGGLWKKTSPKGEFFSGEIELEGKKVRVVVFANDKTNPNTGIRNDKAPDYRILLAREQEAPTSAPSAPAKRVPAKSASTQNWGS